ASNAALRYKPTGAGGAAPAMPQGAARQGVSDDLRREAAALGLAAEQQAVFDEAMAAIQARQQARQAAPAATSGNGAGFGGPRGGGAPSGAMASQIRQRMMQRYREDFAAFRETLDASQAQRWDAAVANLVGATRTTVYRLEGGRAVPVLVRVGATDGTTTELSGGLEAGDLLVTGERAAR